MNTIIYTDGSSRGNPGFGGWGAIIMQKSKASPRLQPGVKSQNLSATVTELGGGEKMTTNNRMELKAAIESLKKTNNSESVVIYTDSKYLIGGITEWIRGWKRNGWKKSDRKDVLNKDLWIELDKLTEGENIRWRYVAGHANNAGNERCDAIATGFADGKKVELYDGPLSGYGFRIRYE